MEDPHLFKQKSKSVDLENSDTEKPQFNSLEQLDELPKLRPTIKNTNKQNLVSLDNRTSQNSNRKIFSNGYNGSKAKFVIHNNAKQANANSQPGNLEILDRKPTNKNLKHVVNGGNSVTQKLPHMTNSYLKKTKQVFDGKKTTPLSDLTGSSQNTQWKKLQQVKKTIEEKKALISQFESVNR